MIHGATMNGDPFAGFDFDDIETDNNPLEPSPEEAAREAQRIFDEENEPRFHPGDEPEETVGSEFPLTSKATDCLHDLIARLQRREGDVLFDAGDPFEGFEVGPGLLTVLAAGPGSGKTSMAMQYCFSALRRNHDLRAVVANAETSFDRLLKRELTRRSGVPARALRFADLTAGQMDAVEAAAAELEPSLCRMDVFEAPFSLPRIGQLASMPPGLLVMDYLQLFSPGDKDARAGANAVASMMRHLCRAGWAVLALSATARTKGKAGSDHNSQSLGMASLRESSDLEYQADAVYLLRDQGPEGDPIAHVRKVQLDCVKNRSGSVGPTDIIFDKPQLKFHLPPQSQAGGDFDDWNGSTQDSSAGDFAPWRARQ